MKLLVTTPLAVVVEADDVAHVRAEDETGAFGILPGHADFLTVLPVSVITWRDGGGAEHHVALRGGVLAVSGGDRVEVATREAVGEDELSRLGDKVLERYRREVRTEEESRLSSARLQVATLYQIQRFLRAGREAVPQGLPAGPRAEASQNPTEFE
jgi:F-type H+-transporting ATPase subunit epsilon